MFGRELEYIRSTRAQAQMQFNTLTDTKAMQTAELEKAQAELDQARGSGARRQEIAKRRQAVTNAQANLDNTNAALARNESILNQYPETMDGIKAATNAATTAIVNFGVRLAS